MNTTLNTSKLVGEIAVDAGLCWIGDPCYILHKEQPPKAIGNSWEEFCDILHEDDKYPTCKQFPYDLGHAGLGVVVSTGYGDGVYPVYAEFNDEGRIAKVWVEFIGQDGAQEGNPVLDCDHGFDIPQSLLRPLAEKALEAFWEVIVQHYPQAQTGDLSPLTTVRLGMMAEAAIAEWLYANVPPATSR